MRDYKKNISTQVALLLLEIKAMAFRFNPPYTFTSGLKSPVYLDNRLVMSYPRVRKKFTDFYVETIKKEVGLKNIDWISGTATAAIPHATWVAERLNLPMVYVRPTTKTYGKGGKVEGYLKKGSKVIIVEDLITTGSSALNNALTIQELGSKVKHVIATITYETKAAKAQFKKHRMKLLALTTARNVIETAYNKGYLNQKQKKSVDLWFEDPQSWAKKMRLGKLE